MKLNSCFFHEKGFFVVCDRQDDFFLSFGPDIGAGRFSFIRPTLEHGVTAGLFQLTEVLPECSLPPESVIAGSNVLWRLPEALEVLKSVPSSDLQAYLQSGYLTLQNRFMPTLAC